MAKRQNFKRQVGADGKVRYFELKKDKRGIEVYKQIPAKEGASKYVKKNYNKVKVTEKAKLTKKEQESLNRSRGQRDLYRFDGRPVKKVITDFFENDQVKYAKDGKFTINFERYADIEREYKRLVQNLNAVELGSEWGAEGWRGRTAPTNIVQVNNQIKPWTEMGYSFEVIDGGDVYSGNKAWVELKRYETEMFDEKMDEYPNLAYLKFKYIIEINHEAGTITINLSDQPEPEAQESDPIKKLKKR